MALKVVQTTADDPAAVSPKVSRPAWVALLLAALTGILGALTPDMFAGLGDFAGPTFLVVGAVLQAVIGFLANDPARSKDEPEDDTGGPAPNDEFPPVG